MKNLVIISALILSSCSSADPKRDKTSKLIVENGVKYHLIRDDLYRDDKGNIYFKTLDVSAAESLDPEERKRQTNINWIHTIYRIGESGEVEEIVELKDLIDTATFCYDHPGEGLVTYYKDKNRSYYYHLMADGGNLSYAK